ncbi:MFS transporter [Planctomonas sp. JC2975]|uniref:MFS transporter n=1 Tax=Planctomonas sp. JC2975 TaxID=2729626 RepID=UPI001474CBD4|nr:MFS transporter [Planctomonas sp. JC2975]
MPELKTGPRAALAVRPYRRWFASQIFSASGTSTQLIGMAWLVAQATGSGIALAGITFAIYLPVLVLGPFAGVLVDRFDRRRLLVWTQVAFIALGTVLAVVTALGYESLPFIYAIGIATGLVNSVDAPARQVYLMDVLDHRLLPSAIGLYEVVMNSARVLGPALAGVLLATVGIVPCFVFNAVSFVPALIALILNRHVVSHREAHAERRARLLDGVRWTLRNPSVIVTLVLASTSGMLFNLTVTLPLITTKTFALDGGVYGTLTAVFGVGALIGAVRATMQTTSPRFRATVSLALGTGLVVILTALAPSVWLFGIGLGLAGAGSIWFIARANAYVQLSAPAPIRGQVMSIWNMALPGMNPFTGLLAGAVADAVSPQAGFGLSGVLYVVIAGVGLLGAAARRRSRTELG